MDLLLARLARHLWPLAVANLVANIAIVVTGAAVRLTGSGLSCPDWPQCSDDSYVPHSELGVHGAIEFGNRMLTFVLVAVVVACWLSARAARATSGDRTPTRLATLIALGVPTQAVIGGILVLTKLNPYVLIGHFLISFPLLYAAAVLVRRALDGPAEPRVPLVRPELRWLTAGLLLTTSAVLALGTLVTGTGPHAGSEEVRRLPMRKPSGKYNVWNKITFSDGTSH